MGSGQCDCVSKHFQGGPKYPTLSHSDVSATKSAFQHTQEAEIRENNRVRSGYMLADHAYTMPDQAPP